MRKMSYVVTVLTLGAWGLAQPMSAGQQTGARVVMLPSANAPITLAAAQVATNPSSLSFTATHAGPKKVSAYTVSVYWFPPAGQRHGFMSKEQQPSTSLGNADVQKAVMALSDRVALGSDSTLIVAVTSATFDDGTEWKNDQINTLVDEKARELKLP